MLVIYKQDIDTSIHRIFIIHLRNAPMFIILLDTNGKSFQNDLFYLVFHAEHESEFHFRDF
jgi:hypothetical protein